MTTTASSSKSFVISREGLEIIRYKRNIEASCVWDAYSTANALHSQFRSIFIAVNRKIASWILAIHRNVQQRHRIWKPAKISHECFIQFIARVYLWSEYQLGWGNKTKIFTKSWTKASVEARSAEVCEKGDNWQGTHNTNGYDRIT